MTKLAEVTTNIRDLRHDPGPDSRTIDAAHFLHQIQAC
jgi:hypothetical protein